MYTEDVFFQGLRDLKISQISGDLETLNYFQTKRRKWVSFEPGEIRSTKILRLDQSLPPSTVELTFLNETKIQLSLPFFVDQPAENLPLEEFLFLLNSKPYDLVALNRRTLKTFHLESFITLFKRTAFISEKSSLGDNEILVMFLDGSQKFKVPFPKLLFWEEYFFENILRGALEVRCDQHLLRYFKTFHCEKLSYDEERIFVGQTELKVSPQVEKFHVLVIKEGLSISLPLFEYE